MLLVSSNSLFRVVAVGWTVFHCVSFRCFEYRWQNCVLISFILSSGIIKYYQNVCDIRHKYERFKISVLFLYLFGKWFYFVINLQHKSTTNKWSSCFNQHHWVVELAGSNVRAMHLAIHFHPIWHWSNAWPVQILLRPRNLSNQLKSNRWNYNREIDKFRNICSKFLKLWLTVGIVIGQLPNLAQHWIG